MYSRICKFLPGSDLNIRVYLLLPFLLSTTLFTLLFIPSNVFAAQIGDSGGVPPPIANDIVGHGGLAFTATASGTLTDALFYPRFFDTAGTAYQIQIHDAGTGTVTCDSSVMIVGTDGSTNSAVPVLYHATFTPDPGGGDCNLIAGHTYQNIVIQGSSGDMGVFSDASGFAVGTWYNGSPFGPSDPCELNEVGTCIYTVTPVGDVPPWNNAEATSTTFAFGASGSVPPADFVNGMNLIIFYANNAQNGNLLAGPSFATDGVSGADFVNGTFTFPISSSGNFSFSTSTDIEQVGVYTLKTSITSPLINFFGFSFGTQTLVSTTTQFEVATSTTFDQLQAEVTAQALGLASTTSASCDINFSTVLEFSTYGQCIQFLAIPSATQTNTLLHNANSELFAKAPWGYATDLYNDLTATTSSTTLPALSITFPASQGLPVAVGGVTLNLTPWNEIAGPGTFLASATVPETGTNILNKFLTYWDLLWYLMFGLWMLNELLGAWRAGDFEFIGGMGGGAQNAGIKTYRGLVTNRSNLQYKAMKRTQTNINRRSI